MTTEQQEQAAQRRHTSTFPHGPRGGVWVVYQQGSCVLVESVHADELTALREAVASPERLQVAFVGFGKPIKGELR